MTRVALSFALALGLGCRSAPSSSGEVGDPLRLVDGPGVLAAVEASPATAAVVLNLWATWCAPCKEEFPAFVRVGAEYADRGVELMFVSLDFPEERPKAVEFLQAQGAKLPSWAKKGKDHPFITALHPRWSGALPATFIFGPDKKMRHFWEGKVEESMLTRALDDLLAESAAAAAPRGAR